RKPERISKAPFRRYRKYRSFAEKLSRDNIIYNHQCDEIERLHKEGRLLRMVPSKEVLVARVEGDMEKLGDLYWLGYNDCLFNLDLIKEYLK
ncbi:MAG: hypothetical protein K6G03_01060, partial [Lachnospiraceae bacterium]|nr:hypothetical protein [Lachnospiraceae bacterium]